MTELTHQQAFLFGLLHALGLFDLSELSSNDAIDTGSEHAYFALGETAMAALLALSLTAPAYLWLSETSTPAASLTAAALIFLPLFVFVPKFLRYMTQADTEAVIAAFGKNEQIKKVFWTIFLALTGSILAQVLDPALAAKILALLAGT